MSYKGIPANDDPIEAFHSKLEGETFLIQSELGSSRTSVRETVQNFIKRHKKRIQQNYGYLSLIDYRK